jgi:MFS family permease
MPRTWRILPAFMLVYVLLYAAFGLESPFLPALLHERGLPAGELGVLLAASTAIRVFAGPAIAQSSDRLQRHTFILCACALLAALAGLGYVLLESFLPLLTIALLQSAMLAPIVPVSDALATTATQASLSDGRTRFDYGRIRAVGSAAFVIGATVGGWAVAKTGLATMPWLAGTVLAIGGAASLLLPGISVTWSGGPVSFARDWAVLLRLAIYRGPAGSDGTGRLRHIVHRIGDRAAHLAVRCAVRPDRRACVSGHGGALSAGAAAVRWAACARSCDVSIVECWHREVNAEPLHTRHRHDFPCEIVRLC